MSITGSFYGRSTVVLQPEIFDFDLFDHLTMGEIELQLEVIALFKLQVETTILAMNHVQAIADWIVMAHTLKGAASSVGAAEIMALAHRWEQYQTQLQANALLHARQSLHECAHRYFCETSRVLDPLVKASRGGAGKLVATAFR